MAASVAGLIARFPEFDVDQDDRLAIVLASVELRIGEEWGTLRDEVIYLETADTLSSSTSGRNARKAKDGNGGSVYATKLQQLREQHALRFRVTYRRP